MFLAQVNKNQIDVKQTEQMTSGSQNVYVIHFDFSDEWSTLTRVAVFKGGQTVINVPLNDENECLIPWEVLTQPDTTVMFGVYGSMNGNVVLPTVWATAGILLEGVTTGIPGREPTPDIYQNIIARLVAIEGKIESCDIGGSNPEPFENPLPLGGTTGQVLAKESDDNYDVHWVDPGTGPAGEDGKDGIDGADGEDGKDALRWIGADPLIGYFYDSTTGQVISPGATVNLSSFNREPMPSEELTCSSSDPTSGAAASPRNFLLTVKVVSVSAGEVSLTLSWVLETPTNDSINATINSALKGIAFNNSSPIFYTESPWLEQNSNLERPYAGDAVPPMSYDKLTRRPTIGDHIFLIHTYTPTPGNVGTQRPIFGTVNYLVDVLCTSLTNTKRTASGIVNKVVEIGGWAPYMEVKEFPEMKTHVLYIYTKKGNSYGSVAVIPIADGADGAQGKQGPAGAKGADGVSPTVEVTEIDNGHQVAITDVNGTQTFDVLNGKDGADGSAGDGESLPTPTKNDEGYLLRAGWNRDTNSPEVKWARPKHTIYVDNDAYIDSAQAFFNAINYDPLMNVSWVIFFDRTTFLDRDSNLKFYTGDYYVNVTYERGDYVIKITDLRDFSTDIWAYGLLTDPLILGQNNISELPQTLPSGGTTGQVLSKTSDANYDVEWIDAPSGGNSDSGSSGPVLWTDIEGRPDLSNLSIMRAVKATLNADMWVNGEQIVPIEGISEDEDSQLIIPVSTSASKAAYKRFGIQCESQAENALTFSATVTPTEDISVNIYIFESAEIQESFSNWMWWSPKMTSDNTPEPYVVSVSSTAGVNPGWQAFDGDRDSTIWHSENIANSWIVLDMGAKTFIKGVRFWPYPTTANSWYNCVPNKFTVQGSDDGENWADIYAADGSKYSESVPGEPQEYGFAQLANYRYYKIVSNGNYKGDNYFVVNEIEFYIPEVYADGNS